MARYFRTQLVNPISQYVAEPLNLYQGKLENMQGAQDKSQAEIVAANKAFGYVPTEEEAALAMQTKSELDKQVESIKDLDINNPSDKRKILEGIKKVRSAYEPGGQAYAHKANFDAYTENVKYLDELLKKKPGEGGIDANAYEYFKKKALEDFKSTGQVQNGQYKRYNGITPALNPDIDQQVIEATKDWKSNAISKGYWTDLSGKQWAIKNSSDLEYIDPNEVKQAVLADIMNRPENQAYAEQQAEIAFYGKDDTNGYDQSGNPMSYRPGYLKGQFYNSIFERPADLAAARLGFTKESTDQDIRENGIYRDDYNRAAEKQYPLQQTTEDTGRNFLNSLAANPEYQPFVKPNPNGDSEIDWNAVKDNMEGKSSSILGGIKDFFSNFLDMALTPTVGIAKVKQRAAEKVNNAREFISTVQTSLNTEADILKSMGALPTDFKVTPATFNDVMRASSQFSKVRGMALEYQGEVADAYSEEVNDRRENYTFLRTDSNTPITPDSDDSGVLIPYNAKEGKGTKLQASKRVTKPVIGSDGKPTGKFETTLMVTDQNGVNYFAEPKAAEEQEFFNNLYTINTDGLNAIRTGKPQYENQSIIPKNKLESIRTHFDSNATDGAKVAAITNSPKDGVIAVTFNYPGNQQVIQEFAYDSKDNRMIPVSQDMAPNEYMSIEDANWGKGVYSITNNGYKGTKK